MHKHELHTPEWVDDALDYLETKEYYNIEVTNMNSSDGKVVEIRCMMLYPFTEVEMFIFKNKKIYKKYNKAIRGVFKFRQLNVYKNGETVFAIMDENSRDIKAIIIVSLQYSICIGIIFYIILKFLL